MEALQFLIIPFIACLILVGIHAYLGIHVLARGVIFVDIALAQIAALGATVAILAGHDLESPQAYFYSLGFTFVGATIFALSRNLRERVPQEAFIGITYAVASALAIVILSVSPAAGHAAEHLRDSLVGNLLFVDAPHVERIAAIYGVIGIFHVVFRKKFLRLSFDHDAPESKSHQAMLWDLLFYMSFGFVITSSVHIAGVLLVFSFLVVPAVFGAMFAQGILARLIISWTLGFLVSVVGMVLSYKTDTPPGAVIIATFGGALLLAAVVRVVLTRMNIATHTAVFKEGHEHSHPGIEVPGQS
jgi:zinc/manganese transport system permease protein